MAASGGHLDLVTLFDTDYNLCMVRLRVLFNGTQVTSTLQRFGSFSALLAWINANAPHSGGSFDSYVFVDVSDEIDASVPVPTKLYGKNRLWAGLTNKAPGHHYWRPKTTSCRYANTPVSPFAATERAKTLRAIWTILYPTAVLPDPDVTPWTDAEFSLFWIAGNLRSRYDMPIFLLQGLSILVPSPGDRYYWNGIAPQQVVANTYFAYNAQASDKCAYGAIVASGPGFAQAFGARQAFVNLGMAILSGQSVVVGYPVVDGVGNPAVVVRPVGVDQWYVDNYDTTQYRLEAVGSTRHDERPKIQVLSLPQYPEQRAAGPFNALDIGACFGNTWSDRMASPGKHSLSTGSVRIQYRDTTTGKVSPLSIPHIVPVSRKRARPFSLLVKNTQMV
jgi:hypothetical protein